MLAALCALLLICPQAMEHRRRRAHADTHMMLYGDEDSSSDAPQPVMRHDLHPSEPAQQPPGSLDVTCTGALVSEPQAMLTAAAGTPRLEVSPAAQPSQLEVSGDTAASVPTGNCSHNETSALEVAFSWTTCVSCVVALTLRQHPSPMPSETWAIPALQTGVLRTLLQCAVDATSLNTVLGEVNVRLLGEGLSQEHAVALTDTLHRWYIAHDPPSGAELGHTSVQ